MRQPLTNHLSTQLLEDRTFPQDSRCSTAPKFGNWKKVEPDQENNKNLDRLLVSVDFSIDWNFVFLNDRYHACGHYSVGNSLRLLVTGGYDGNQVISFPCLFFYMSVFLLHIFLKIRIRIRFCDKEINCDHHIIICTSWDFWLFTGNTWACTQFNLIINTTPHSFFLVFIKEIKI